MADICVVGGGPAGSSVAYRLAGLGYDVCLIERDIANRPQRGASLPATILPLLEMIGARASVEAAGFSRCGRSAVWWSEAQPSVHDLPQPALHVDRRQFDRLLLESARQNGVCVLHPAHAPLPERLEGGGWRVRVVQAGVPTTIIARFLVDASGGTLQRRRRRVSAPLLALQAEWACAPRRNESCLEAGTSEWFWCGPLREGRSVAAVFVDPKRLTDFADIAAAYRELLARFRLIHRCGLREVVGAVSACDASSRFAQEPAGLDFVRVGDACLSLDPLSSQGIQTAIASGLQAAVVANTILRRRANSTAAVAFYEQAQRERCARHATKTARLYAERGALTDTPFWRERAAHEDEANTFEGETRRLDPGIRLHVSRLATIESVPAIRGDTIETTGAVCHPALARPAAFLGDVALVPLIRQIGCGETAGAIVAAWSACLSFDRSWQLLDWLWHRRIVVPLGASG